MTHTCWISGAIDSLSITFTAKKLPSSLYTHAQRTKVRSLDVLDFPPKIERGKNVYDILQWGTIIMEGEEEEKM
jgi:hypothetical protein